MDPDPHYWLKRMYTYVLRWTYSGSYIIGRKHGTYIRWELRNRWARKEQYLLIDLVKAFDHIYLEKTLTCSDKKFFTEKVFSLYTCLTRSELP